MKTERKLWPPLDEIDGETEHLVTLIEKGWDWTWPGWKWVAESLNKEYNNNRTAKACRKKYDSLIASQT